MERVEIEAFLALSEELHFGRTAERLGLSTGRVSQIIRRLERRAGVALFERTSRRVEATAVGRELAADLSRAQEAALAAWDRAVAAGREVSGTLRLGLLGMGTPEGMLPVMEEFRRRHPACEPVLACEAQIDDHLAPLRAGRVDVLMTRFSPRQPAWVAQGPTLLDLPMVLAVPAGHPLARRSEVVLDDLGGPDGVTVLMGSTPNDWWDERVPAETPAGLPVRRRRLASTLPILLTLVAAGQGVSPMANGVTRFFTRFDVEYVPMRVPPEPWGLLWRASEEDGRIRAFAATAEAVVDRMGGPAAMASWLVDGPAAPPG